MLSVTFSPCALKRIIELTQNSLVLSQGKGISMKIYMGRVHGANRQK